MNPALKKGLAIIGVALLLMIPLAWLRGLVTERETLREQAVAAVARGWGDRQLVSGPVLAIPITWTATDGKERSNTWYVLPETLNLDVEMVIQQERRKLGIYEVPVYVAKVHATGQFDVAPARTKPLVSDPDVHVHFDRSRLLIPIEDPRGVRQIADGAASLTQGRFEPAKGFPLAALSAPLRPDVDPTKGKHAFDLTFEVAGTQSLAFIPLSHASRVQVRGNWPDPGFARGFLPLERHVRDGRFDASWQALDLNRSFETDWFEAEVTLAQLQDAEFGVDLVQPVDLYQQVERAIKYAAVFICLSFLTLFIWDNLTRRAVHPIQYGLTGLALSIFFLLLLALAEHIGFGLAYVIAALALCSLLGVYLARLAASGYFAALYGFMYLLVISDDYALLAGALGLFIILAVAMVLTRKVDWYQTA